jgi:putative membrane protein
MKLWMTLAAALGLGVTAALIWWTGYAEIVDAVTQVGWGVALVVGFHLVQLVASSLAWQTLLSASQGPRLATVMGARWVREAVNNLLAVAQIGGEVVGARLLHLTGIPVGTSGAAVTVDLMIEAASQFAFTVLGLLLLIPAQDNPQVTLVAIVGIALAMLIVLVLAVVQRSGLFRFIERALLRIAEKFKWPALADVHRAILTLCDDRKRLGVAFSWQMISWLLGGFEVMLILNLVGVSVDFRQGLIIEGLGQAARGLGFFVPGSLGVQEGGYALVCGLLGISPASGIELSLLKRIRELVLGVPALIVWQVIEVRGLVAGRGETTAAVPARTEGD